MRVYLFMSSFSTFALFLPVLCMCVCVCAGQTRGRLLPTRPFVRLLFKNAKIYKWLPNKERESKSERMPGIGAGIGEGSENNTQVKMPLKLFEIMPCMLYMWRIKRRIYLG